MQKDAHFKTDHQAYTIVKLVLHGAV